MTVLEPYLGRMTSSLPMLSRWLPSVRPGALTAMFAAKAYCPGDVVDVCYCLPLEREELLGTFLDMVCFDAADGEAPILKLFPLGLGLMYNHAASPNMRFDHKVDSFGAHWLLLQALRPIIKGEQLTVSRGVGTAANGQVPLPVIEAAAVWVEARLEEAMPLEPWWFLPRTAVRLFGSLRAPLRDISFGHGCAGERVRVARSRIQGLGVFAREDFVFGEVIDICPILKVMDDEVPEVLKDYTFGGPPPEEVSYLPLGASMIINHSSTDFNVTWDLSLQSEFIMFWIAIRNIEANEELLHDYGHEYWDDEGREELPSNDVVGNQTAVVKAMSLLGFL